MTRYLFSSLLLLLLVSCALCGVVSVKGSDLFVAESVEALKPDRSSKETYDMDSVSSPSMAGDDDILLGHVLAKIKTYDTYIIFTRFIETGAGWPDDTADKKNWESQAATAQGGKEVIAFATVKKGTNFYTLYAHRSDSSGETKPWEVKLATGAITGDAGKKEITWTEKEVDESKVSIKNDLIGKTPVDGSAFLIGDKPVFVLRGEKDDGNNNVFAIARMDGDGAGGDWTFTFVEMEKGCDAAFFSLDGKICMAPKGKDCTDKDLKVLDDSKKSWVAPTGAIAENLKKQKVAGDFFLPINIDGKGDVLLITEKKENAKTPKNTDFFLYFARGKHMEKLPNPIIENVEDTSDASLVYSKDQLFFLSQRDAKVDLERLKDAPAEIKKVLKEWSDSALRGNSVNIGVLLCALFGILAPFVL